MNRSSALLRICSAILAVTFMITCCAITSLAENKSGEMSQRKIGKIDTGAFTQLPLGAVQAQSWLLQQLYYQKEGLTSYIHDNFPNYTAQNAWRGGNGQAWEQGPYYLRGLIALAWTLDDAALKKTAMEWIDPILESGLENGYFGPTQHGDGTNNHWDWWPHLVTIQALRDYFEATEFEGNPDERVLPLLENFFKFQLNYLPYHPFDFWPSNRGADNLEVVLWYYARAYDPQQPEKSEWLIDLAEILVNQTWDWEEIYQSSTVRKHVVNTAESVKYPAVVWQLQQKDSLRQALRQGLRNIALDHGRVDGLANADENPADNLPYRGTETCAVIESMLSAELSLRIFAEGWIGDWLESLAYNNLPACFSPDFKSHVYYQCQNQVMASHGDHGFSNEYGCSSAYSVLCGCECCFPNMHVGWPKFVSSMWMGTADGGLAVTAYGPNRVTATVNAGKKAVFEQKTDYPFKDTVFLTYSGENASFPLLLRIPQWCKNPKISVNETAVAVQETENGFLRIQRNWSAGDEVQVTFPMEVRLSHWYNDAVAVQYGALIFSLEIAEDWRPVYNNFSGFLSSETTTEYKNYEAFAASDWNYALVLDWDNVADSFSVEIADEIPMQPFNRTTSPIRILATGQSVPEWTLNGNITPAPPYSPIAANPAKQTRVTLIPYGSARLRITQMPWVGTVSADLSTVRTAQQALRYQSDGKQTLEFDNVMVRPAENYRLQIDYSGTGTITAVINEKHTKILSCNGEKAEINNLASLSDDFFRFGYGQYNNIRLITDGKVTVNKISVAALNPFTQPKVIGSKFSEDGSSVKIATNIPDHFGGYWIDYGTQSGKYTHTVENAVKSSTQLWDIQGAKTVYLRIRTIVNGKSVTTQEFAVKIDNSASSFGFTDDFAQAGISQMNWTAYGDDYCSYQNGKAHFGDTPNIKYLAGSESWTDYVIEATMSGGAAYGLNRPANFGIAFRASEATTYGPDSFKAQNISFNVSGGGGLIIGYHDGGAWYQTAAAGNFKYQVGKEYKIKIIVCGNAFRVLMDGKQVYQGATKFDHGMVGLRSYQQDFSVSHFSVRKPTAAEYNALQQDPSDTVELPAKSTAEINPLMSVGGYKFLKVSVKAFAASKYKLVYGTQPGVYTSVVNELPATGLGFDSFCVPVAQNSGTYYARLIDVSAGTEGQNTREFKVNIGTRYRCNNDIELLDNFYRQAKETDISKSTRESRKRMNFALQLTESLQQSPESAVLCDVSLAKQSLLVAMHNVIPASPEELREIEAEEREKANQNKTSFSHLLLYGAIGCFVLLAAGATGFVLLRKKRKQ